MKEKGITELSACMPWDLSGNFGADVKHKIHCSYCGKDWLKPVSHMLVKSDFNSAVFCSYNCRSNYYKKHKKEREEYFNKKNEFGGRY